MREVYKVCGTCGSGRSRQFFPRTYVPGWMCWECATGTTPQPGMPSPAPPAAAQGIQPAPWSRYGQAAAPYYAELQAYIDYMHRQLVLAKSLERPSFVMMNGAWERCDGTAFASGLPGTVIKYNPPPQGDSMRKSVHYMGAHYTREFVNGLVEALNKPLPNFKVGDKVRHRTNGIIGIVLPSYGSLAAQLNAKHGEPGLGSVRILCVKDGCVGETYTWRVDDCVSA